MCETILIRIVGGEEFVKVADAGDDLLLGSLHTGILAFEPLKGITERFTILRK